MRLEELIFVTSNLGKLREANAIFDVSLEHRALDLPEVQSLDLEEVIHYKVKMAQQRVFRPILVEDTSLELVGMGGFPGPLVRWLLASVGAEGICRLASAFDDRRARVRCIACAASGSEEIVGLGIVDGEIARKARGSRGFGWDSVFIPEGGGGKTYAELNTEEKNRISHRRKALEALRVALEGKA